MNKQFLQNTTPSAPFAIPVSHLPLDSDDRRICNIQLIVDTSASMAHHQEMIVESVIKSIKLIRDKNDVSEDVRFKIKLVVFDKDVRELCSVPLDPGDLLDTLDENALVCKGPSTNIPAMLKYLDNTFSRSSSFIGGLHKGDYKTFTTIITDYENTTSETEAVSCREHLMHNILYTDGNETMVVYCGNAKRKHDAEILANGEEKVVALGDDIDLPLDALIQQASVSFVNGSTHVKGEGNGSTQETIQGIIDREGANETDSTAIDDDSKKIDGLPVKTDYSASDKQKEKDFLAAIMGAYELQQ